MLFFVCTCYDDREQDTQGCWINAVDFMIAHARASEMPFNGSRWYLRGVSC